MIWEYIWRKVWLPEDKIVSDPKRRAEAQLHESVETGTWVAFDYDLQQYVPLQDALTKLGLMGWELATSHDAYHRVIPGLFDNYVPDLVYVFKRPGTAQA